MEAMLEQIYLSVKDKDGPIPAGSAREKAETPATAGQDDLSVIRRSLAEMELDSKLVDRIVDKVRRGAEVPKGLMRLFPWLPEL